eukprot:g31435.t1
MQKGNISMQKGNSLMKKGNHNRAGWGSYASAQSHDYTRRDEGQRKTLNPQTQRHGGNYIHRPAQASPAGERGGYGQNRNKNTARKDGSIFKQKHGGQHNTMFKQKEHAGNYTHRPALANPAGKGSGYGQNKSKNTAGKGSSMFKPHKKKPQQHSSPQQQVAQDALLEEDDDDDAVQDFDGDNANLSGPDGEDSDQGVVQLAEGEQDGGTSKQEKTKTTKTTKKKKMKKKLGKADKSAPEEMSSKKAVSRFRQVVPGKRARSRDPRFVSLPGQEAPPPALFKKAYAFLDEYKQREVAELKKALKKANSAERKAEIQGALDKYKQEEKRQQVLARQQEQVLARQQEMDKAMKNAQVKLVKTGQKPFFPKRAIQKELVLANQFLQLKQEGKLESFMAKKRKKKEGMEKKHLPNEKRRKQTDNE